MNIYNVTNVNSIIINRKSQTYLFNPAFFMLLNVKPFEVLPQNNGYGYLSESFALN